MDGGDNEFPLTILYGDQGEAHETVRELTGATRNNIKIKLDWGGGTEYVIKGEDGESKVGDISGKGEGPLIKFYRQLMFVIWVWCWRREEKWL